MSKELKAPDKVTQKMTRDGAVAENLATGETTSISERPQEENYSAPAAGAAEKATQRIGTEVSRHLEKGAEKKALDAAQLKTIRPACSFPKRNGQRRNFKKAIKKSDKAADCLDAARGGYPNADQNQERDAFLTKRKARQRRAFPLKRRISPQTASCGITPYPVRHRS